MNLLSELVIAASAFIYATAHLLDVLHDIMLDAVDDEMPEGVKHMYN